VLQDRGDLEKETWKLSYRPNVVKGGSDAGKTPWGRVRGSLTLHLINHDKIRILV